MKKQAQQPPSDTRPRLRPSRSSGAHKLSEISKKPEPPRFGPAIPTNGRSSGYTGKAVKDARQLRGATRDKRPFSAAGCISPTEAVTQSRPSGPSTDRGRERVIQGSAAAQPNLLFQPAHAQTSSTQASVDQSIGFFPDIVDPGLLSSWGHSANPLGTQLSQAVPVKTPITCASPLGPASSKGPSVEVPHTHRLYEKRSAFPNEIAQSLHTDSNILLCTGLIVPLQLQCRTWNPKLSRLQLSHLLVLSPTCHCRHVNVYSFSSALAYIIIIITSLARHNTASQFIPVVSLSQCEPDEPSETVPIHSQAVHPGLPTPELIDAFSPTPPRKQESAYNHPALQLPADDDSEWTTFPQRKPRPRKQPKDLMTNSAKFYLPIWSPARPPTKEPHEERMEKRPRITLYRPPPRTVNADLTGIESRYACVRNSIRKVRIPR